MKNWQKLVIPEKAKLKFALEKIDELASGCIFLSDNHNRLVGVLTDGDIRRSLLNGAALENLCSEYMNTEPKYIRDHSKLDDIGLHKNNPDLNYVPVIGNSGQINEILDKQERFQTFN